MRLNSQEVEATLVICSERPRVIESQISDLPMIGNYRLLPRDTKEIHDLYFDTIDHALKTQNLALRIRKIGATRWITMKGHSQPTGFEGLVDRSEIEVRWSQSSLRRVIQELEDRRIGISHRGRDFDYAHPLEVLQSYGLKIIQDRKSHRKIRNIVKMEERDLILAELAIDFVIYRFNSQEIRHHEVEIEVKQKSGFKGIKTIIEHLISMYHPSLRRWGHSKLATGKAVEEMMYVGELEGLLDTDKHLKPAAYDKIDEYLKYRINSF